MTSVNCKCQILFLFIKLFNVLMIPKMRSNAHFDVKTTILKNMTSPVNSFYPQHKCNFSIYAFVSTGLQSADSRGRHRAAGDQHITVIRTSSLLESTKFTTDWNPRMKTNVKKKLEHRFKVGKRRNANRKHTCHHVVYNDSHQQQLKQIYLV